MGKIEQIIRIFTHKKRFLGRWKTSTKTRNRMAKSHKFQQLG